MAKFSVTKEYEITCPECASGHVIKSGTQNGQQRYLCKDCNKRFRAGGKAPGRRMESSVIGSAIRGFYDGRNYKKISLKATGTQGSFSRHIQTRSD